MYYKKEIENVISELKRKNIEVSLLDEAEEGIEIGELKKGRMTVNTKARDCENLLFTLGHLFGHYVQFNNYEKYKHLIEKVEESKPIKVTQKFKDEFWEYEKEAFRIGKGLILSVTQMSEELERQFEIFMHADFEFFFKFLETGINITPEELNIELEKRNKSDISFKEYLSPIKVDQNMTIDPGMYVHIY
jgi:hypothetical protein